ncbi:jg19800 [Pararge aegeria aegeria]|uniref:Jg19800 protein n=1 Tax=Pararge aegeria aegeria TaxID=348720 RepID=A0A8S4SBP2_9NEOP|nr:jg19800 [Pararge aegeria aegeria]
MPRKPKESAAKKPPPQILRPNISDSSLNYIPGNALAGYQERIEKGIEWTLEEEAARYHREKCRKENIPVLTFTEALRNKIQKSILHGFLDENSTFSLKEHWEVLLPMIIWDNEKSLNEEGKICFNDINCITDDMIGLVKRAVQHDDREVLKKEFKMVTVLRVNDSEMTELDAGLKSYHKLSTLNLCGNFISDVEATVLPDGLKMLELKANRISYVSFAEHLPRNLIYLGLSRNLLNKDFASDLAKLPYNISVLDLSDNDICDLEAVLTALSTLPSLVALYLAGNPCSVSTAYARTTLMRLSRLQWLDSREVLPTDRHGDTFEPHPDDLRSVYFNFSVIRIMSALQPPKAEKGAVTAFHVEIELPLLDSSRRRFLMFRNNESLTELLPLPEDEDWPSQKAPSVVNSNAVYERDAEASSHASDIYNHLQPKNSREVIHFTIFESNRVQWNKVMNFQEPTVRIFCPNLTALRDTFRSVITVRFVYTMIITTKQKTGKSAQSLRPPGEQRLTVATIKCALKRPDWSQPLQYFHWDDSLGTDEAIHWGDGDLSVLQYTQQAVKTAKGKLDTDPGSGRQSIPENLTCHFGFGIETLK